MRVLSEHELRGAHDRFMSKADQSAGPMRCWPWRGAKQGRYGAFRIGSVTDGSRRQIGAHVFACALGSGIPPSAADAHHACRNPICVNPSHLSWQSGPDHSRAHRSEFIEGGRRAARNPKFIAAHGLAQRRRTTCSKGHPYNSENTRRTAGQRACPCGCGKPVPPRRNGRPAKYATQRCWHRARTREQRRLAGERGGTATARSFERRLVNRLLTLDPSEAILRAYYLGRRAAYSQRRRAA